MRRRNAFPFVRSPAANGIELDGAGSGPRRLAVACLALGPMSSTASDRPSRRRPRRRSSPSVVALAWSVGTADDPQSRPYVDAIASRASTTPSSVPQFRMASVCVGVVCSRSIVQAVGVGGPPRHRRRPLARPACIVFLDCGRLLVHVLRLPRGTDSYSLPENKRGRTFRPFGGLRPGITRFQRRLSRRIAGRDPTRRARRETSERPRGPRRGTRRPSQAVVGRP